MIVSDVASGFSGITANKIGDLLDSLDRAYPSMNGYWRIAINEAGNMITVTNLLLSNRNGFCMHIDKIDPEGRKVVRFAGELLERYRISRSRHADVISEVMTGERDFKRELICDA